MPLKEEDIIDPYPHTGESEAKGRGPPEREAKAEIIKVSNALLNTSEKNWISAFLLY